MAKSFRLGYSAGHSRGQDGLSNDPGASDRQSASLAGLAVTLLVLVVCVFLFRELQAKSVVEDCLLQGGMNCDQILAGQV